MRRRHAPVQLFNTSKKRSFRAQGAGPTRPPATSAPPRFGSTRDQLSHILEQEEADDARRRWAQLESDGYHSETVPTTMHIHTQDEIITDIFSNLHHPAAMDSTAARQDESTTDGLQEPAADSHEPGPGIGFRRRVQVPGQLLCDRFFDLTVQDDTSRKFFAKWALWFC